MKVHQPKPCRVCGAIGHTATFCFFRRGRKPPRMIGKYGKKWLSFRAQWFIDHPPNAQGLYICYYCGDALLRRETTLDHMFSRVRHPELRFEETNIVTACKRCNREKGSLDAEEFLQRD